MILNVNESQGAQDDWGLVDAKRQGDIPERVSTPKRKDLRPKKGWSIEDQGMRGACVGYALASVLHWHWMKKGGNYRIKPSKRWIWGSAKETDEIVGFPTVQIEEAGTTIKGALEVMRRFGCLTDRELSMKKETTMLPRVVVEERAGQRKLKSYYRLEGLDEIRYWVAYGGPVIAMLRPDRQFVEANRRSGVLGIPKPDRGGGHAVVVCAYRSDVLTLRNSYGRSWGNRGYVDVSELYGKLMLRDFYWVVV